MFLTTILNKNLPGYLRRAMTSLSTLPALAQAFPGSWPTAYPWSAPALGYRFAWLFIGNIPSGFLRFDRDFFAA